MEQRQTSFLSRTKVFFELVKARRSIYWRRLQMKKVFGRRTPGHLSGADVLTILAMVWPVAEASAAELGTCGIQTTAPAAVAAGLDSILMKTVDPEPELAQFIGSAPGAVLSVRGPDWRYVRSIGVADPDTGVPIDCEMPFQIGSNTKMMTAVVLLQLVEEGKLGLDDPLARHLPEIAAGLPNGEAMTLRHLATHTSGVFSYTDNAPDGTPGVMEGDLTDPVALRRSYRPGELIDFATAHGQPDFEPGAEGNWHYSNTGYVLIGLVIEKIEGRPISESFRERIFDPLGMHKTILWDGVPSPELGLPRAFFAAPFDIETTEWNMSQGWAAGAVISNVTDMHRFIEALFAGGLFQHSETLELMKTAVPSGMITMQRYGVGLGEKAPGLWGHGGQTMGFESDVAFFEAQGISVVGWGTSAKNLMGIGAMSVAQELQRLAVIPDPANEPDTVLRDQLIGTAWQLRSIEEAGGKFEAIDVPERYVIEFDEEDRIAIQADCNRVLGSWNLDRLVLSITPGPSTRAACPPGSKADAFVTALGAAVNAVVVEGNLTITAGKNSGFSSLTLEAMQ